MLRYFTVYGLRQRPDMAFHKILKAMLHDAEFTVYDDGYQPRVPLHEGLAAEIAFLRELYDCE